MTVYCLADFFNLDLWPTGREASFPDLRIGLDDLVAAAVNAAGKPNELTLRLYGGWHGEVPNSRETLRDLTSKVIRNIRTRSGSTRLRVELAETPIWDRSTTLLRTVKQVAVRRIPGHLKVSHGCPHPTTCALEDFRKWSRGRCPVPGCSCKLGESLVQFVQKMVDTLIVADALTIRSEGMADRVLIASDDEDVIPALLGLSSLGMDTIHLRRKREFSDYYDDVLTIAGVTSYLW